MCPEYNDAVFVHIAWLMNGTVTPIYLTFTELRFLFLCLFLVKWLYKSTNN